MSGGDRQPPPTGPPRRGDRPGGAAREAIRVAFDARYLAEPTPRGMDRYLLGLTEELPRLGIDVVWFHRARQEIHPAHRPTAGCEIVGLADRGAVWWEQLSVPAALARGRFDLYHAPAERGVPYASPCPVVFSLHSATQASYCDLVPRGRLPGPVSDYIGYDPRPRRGGLDWRRYYIRGQTRRADHILTPSEFARGEIVRLLRRPPSRVTATPLGLPDLFRRPAVDPAPALARLGARRPYVLYVGGYERHKNVPGLLAAMALVRVRRPDVRLVAVGTGAVPDRLVEQGRTSGLRPGEDVTFLANLTDDLLPLYDGAGVFASLSSRSRSACRTWRRWPAGCRWWRANGRGPRSGRRPGVPGRSPRSGGGRGCRPPGPRARRAGRRRRHGPEAAAAFTWARTAEQTAAVYRTLLRDRNW